MGTLLLFNFILILIIAAALVAVKKWVRSDRGRYWVLLAAPLITIAVHYSSFIYLWVTGGDAYGYLNATPNLILPIYPCNVVMWCSVFYGLLPSKSSRLALLLSDYVFWFGITATLVGMFANVDFIMNPTLADYEVTKSILAHATLLFNLLLIPVMGLLRPDFWRNMRNLTIGVVAMLVIGLYCNTLFRVLVSAEAAYDVNSMFLIHSPFEDLPLLRYPLIATVGLVIYFGIFTVCDVIRKPHGERWYDRARGAIRK